MISLNRYLWIELFESLRNTFESLSNDFSAVWKVYWIFGLYLCFSSSGLLQRCCILEFVIIAEKSWCQKIPMINKPKNLPTNLFISYPKNVTITPINWSHTLPYCCSQLWINLEHPNSKSNLEHPNYLILLDLYLHLITPISTASTLILLSPVLMLHETSRISRDPAFRDAYLTYFSLGKKCNHLICTAWRYYMK